MSTTTETLDRNIAAEALGVEAGHQARLDRDEHGPFIRVKSDTVHGKSWKVRIHATAAGAPVAMTCEPDGTRRSGHRNNSSTDGIAPCMHCTRALRRMERDGLVRFEAPSVTPDAALVSRWVATEKAFQTDRPARSAAYREAAEGKDGDPFAGF